MSALEVLTIPSNAIFFICAYVAYYVGHDTRPFLYFFAGLISLFYHLCAFQTGLCVASAYLLKDGDFFFAQSLIGSSSLLLIYFPTKYRKWEHYTLILWFFAVFLLIVFFGTSLYIQIALALFGFLLVISYWIFYRIHYKVAFPPYNLDMFILGITMTVLACSLFVIQMMYPDYYGAIHQGWHIAGGLGQIALLLTKDPPKDAKYALIDKELK